MKTKLILAYLLLCLTSTHAQLNSLVQQGLERAYNFEFVEAEKIYNRVIDRYPNSPHGFYRIAQIHFWIYLGTRDQGEYEVFKKFAELTEDRLNKQIGANPNDYRLINMAGNLASFTAMAEAINNSSIDVFWSSKKAVGYFEKAIEINPKFYDAYLGLGLYDYAMSFVPEFLKWAVNLTGLSSDKQRGLKHIKTAYLRGTSTKTEAAFHLSKIYTEYVAEYDSAISHLQSLTSKYPKNSLFLYQYGVTLARDLQFDRALNYFDRVIKLNNKKIPQLVALSHFRKGEIFFKRNQFKTAITQFNQFLDMSKELDLTAAAAFHVAISAKMLGNDEEYERNLLLAQGGNQDLFEDAYGKQKSEFYLKNGISSEELKLIRMKNYLDAGKYKTVIDSLEKEVDGFDSKLQKALSYGFLSEASLRLKKYKNALNYAEQVIQLASSTEKWILVLAELNIAKAYFFTGDKDTAKDYLKKAENRNDYEYKDYLASKIEWLKRRIR